MTRSAEEELVAALDVHDALVVSCARGELTWAEFDRTYDNFYVRYPLDGHESDAQEGLVFAQYASRIVLHVQIWDEILTKVTGDEHLEQQAVRDAGFIGAAEAVRRVRALGSYAPPRLARAGDGRPPLL